MEASRTTALAALSTRPIPGTADSVAPASHLLLRYGALHPRFEAPLELPVRRDLVARLPQVDGQAGEIGGAERRGLQHFRPHHRDAEQVGLELHQQVVGGSPAVDAHLAQLSPESFCIASSTSALWKAIDSSAARAMCAREVPRVRPSIAPRARGSQCGAPRPTKAGTRYTPPLSRTLAASLSISEEDEKNCNSSRSHCTTAPPMNTLPSRAYSFF